MAEITHRDLVVGSDPVHVTDGGRTVHLNKRGTITFSYVSATVCVTTPDGVSREFHGSRGVIQAPTGAKILPYFKRGTEWHVVMVEQFRISLPDKTLEPPGGELDDDDPRWCMARELMEEAHIAVRVEDIEVVFHAMLAPPIIRADVFGGIVHIDEWHLPRELVGGEWLHGEFTVIGTHNLVDLLRARDTMEVRLDLETHLLLDAVAKKVGLVEKRY